MECERTLEVLGRAGNFFEYEVLVAEMAGSDEGEVAQAVGESLGAARSVEDRQGLGRRTARQTNATAEASSVSQSYRRRPLRIPIRAWRTSQRGKCLFIAASSHPGRQLTRRGDPVHHKQSLPVDLTQVSPARGG